MYDRPRPPDNPEYEAYIMKKPLCAPVCPLRNTPCPKELCSWWDGYSECCAILSLAWSLSSIVTVKENEVYDGR